MPKELLDNRKEIELAEGISVYLHPAGLAPRILARFLDIVFINTGLTVINLILSISSLVIGFDIAVGLIYIIGFFIYWGYDLFFELRKVPATLGKRIMKLRVVQLSGTPPTFSSSFIRTLIFQINIFTFGLPAMISILLTRYSQRLGDLAAGTVVVHSMGELEHQSIPINVPPLRPRISLTRAEQVAFVEFGRRYDKLSPSRQDEVVACFAPLKGAANDARSYALGITSFLSKNEE